MLATKTFVPCFPTSASAFVSVKSWQYLLCYSTSDHCTFSLNPSLLLLIHRDCKMYVILFEIPSRVHLCDNNNNLLSYVVVCKY